MGVSLSGRSDGITLYQTLLALYITRDTQSLVSIPANYVSESITLRNGPKATGPRKLCGVTETGCAESALGRGGDSRLDWTPMGLIADGTVKVEESESTASDTVSGAFDFGGAQPFTVPDDLEDIPRVPRVPETPKVTFTDNKATDKQSIPRDRSKSNKERQAEYRARIDMAKEVAPFVEAALNEYIKGRLNGTAIDSATIIVPYWVLQTSKGQEKVSGPISEAMAFHGLAGTDGLSRKFIDLVENHPVIFGMVYIVGAFGYLELVIQKIIRQQADEAAARAASEDSVAIHT